MEYNSTFNIPINPAYQHAPMALTFQATSAYSVTRLVRLAAAQVKRSVLDAEQVSII